jgi:multidrug resistance efflux pump
MDDVREAEEGVFRAECEVRDCQQKLEDEKMRLEGLRSSRKNGEEKSEEEVSAEANIERLQADLDEARKDLASSERIRDFAWTCQQSYHFR